MSAGVHIGARARIGAHARIGTRARIGARTGAGDGDDGDASIDDNNVATVATVGTAEFITGDPRLTMATSVAAGAVRVEVGVANAAGVGDEGMDNVRLGDA